MVFPEHADDSLLFLHVLSSNDKRDCFSGGQEAAVRQTFPTTELGILAVEILVLYKEYV